MNKTLLLSLFSLSLVAGHAQQTLPREEALKVAFILSLDLKLLLDTPIPTDPDIKRPVAIREGDRGCLLFPESKLADTLTRAGKDVVPVAQLWLRQIVPLAGTESVNADKLKTVSLKVGDRTETAILCTLGLKKTGDKTELLIFGKDKNPIVQVPARSMTAKQTDPIELSAAVEGDTAQLTLKLAGQYEATLRFTGE